MVNSLIEHQKGPNTLESKGDESFLHKTRHYDYAGDAKTEVIGWQTAETQDISESIVFVPGLPGDTMQKLDAFITNATNRIKYFPRSQISGILHSGINNNTERLITTGIQDQPRDLNKTVWKHGTPISHIYPVVNGGRMSEIFGKSIEQIGATADDWIDDVKITLLDNARRPDKQNIRIVGHSFGGLFTLIAVGELLRKGALDYDSSKKRPPIKLILVSAPTYYLYSLPDRKALQGSSADNNFTFYEDSVSKDKMGENDARIPMASEYMFSHIWDFLHETNSINVNQDRQLFNIRFRLLFARLAQSAEALRRSDIKIVYLVPYLDRWVAQAGEDLKKLLGDRVIVEKFHIPSSFNHSNIDTNAHDMLEEWLPIALKFK